MNAAKQAAVLTMGPGLGMAVHMILQQPFVLSTKYAFEQVRLFCVMTILGTIGTITMRMWSIW